MYDDDDDDDMTSFFCRGRSDLDKISQTGAEWHIDCGDMVEIESRILIWRMFGQIEWHVILEARAILQGAATRRILWHDPRAKCHVARCCHIPNGYRSLTSIPLIELNPLVRVYSLTKDEIKTKRYWHPQALYYYYFKHYEPSNYRSPLTKTWVTDRAHQPPVSSQWLGLHCDNGNEQALTANTCLNTRLGTLYWLGRHC